MPVILKISLEFGTDLPGCLYLGAQSDLTRHPEERELLFIEGMEFGVTEKRVVDSAQLSDALKLKESVESFKSQNKWMTLAKKTN